MTKIIVWAPAALFGIGALFTVGIDAQRTMNLVRPLDEAIVGEMEGYTASDLTLTEGEARVAGTTNYLLRQFDQIEEGSGNNIPWYSVYVGYYESQTRGRTIHSPKNCLPGSGWEALASTTVLLDLAEGQVPVNRYLVQNDDQRALVIYWYQGRGRVEANEYRVKFDLLWDAAIKRRTEEALVRVVVPIPSQEVGIEGAQELGVRVAERVLPELMSALPS